MLRSAVVYAAVAGSGAGVAGTIGMVLAQADSFFTMGRWTAIFGFSLLIFAAVAALLIEGLARLLDAHSIRRGDS